MMGGRGVCNARALVRFILAAEPATSRWQGHPEGIRDDNRLSALIGLVCGLAAGARMGLIVYLGEVLEIEMGVDLGSADVGVAEKLLHRAQVAAGFQEMAGKAV